ncbi:type 1 glutamine amidotransferase [Orrella daihaiensis]|uniref:Type 1 glutamine amidotransferase n=1 Tax=Orrella daihaiensis TaxID=2782176 RepID=A0ABY4AHM7_9BURK|nr:type 1 glutamine amidotransferase [Orrella daihaiensis]UOD49782.1 type 1 glutamine amidotransferase [Orrella daihaiensis]
MTNMADFIYLNNWDREQPPTRFEQALGTSGLSVTMYRTVQGELPNTAAIQKARGVFVSASVAGAYDGDAWIDALGETLRQLASQEVPMLGLCFGAQVLAWALVGKDQVFKRADRETGYGEIQLTDAGKKDLLTQGLAHQMRTFMWHGDEVRADHPDIIVLANNDVCANHLWRWRRGPVWGIQPHPEMDQTHICEFLHKNREWFVAEGKDVEPILNSLEPNDQLAPIFDRFLALVKNR